MVGTQKQGVGEESPILPRHAAISGLPCFGCHAPGAFFNAPRGVFSHEKHSMFDVHCNQCHDVGGHQGPVKIDTGLCGGCHNLRAFAYEGGGMGKVAFNHAFHAGAFGCNDCHPKTFPMKKGLKKMKMDDMYLGRSCGLCHDGKKAFSSTECGLCHQQGAVPPPVLGVAPYIFLTRSRTSLSGTLCLRAAFLQSSYSGALLSRRPPRYAFLSRILPSPVFKTSVFLGSVSLSAL